MTPNRVLSNQAFVDLSISGTLHFEKYTEGTLAQPLDLGGKLVQIELNESQRTKSREKHGNNYINYEVAIVLLQAEIFHYHKKILFKNTSDRIFEWKISLYVRS